MPDFSWLASVLSHQLSVADYLGLNVLCIVGGWLVGLQRESDDE